MVKRYNPVRQHGGCIMVEYEDGEYVRHREHAALAKRCERLEGALRELADAFECRMTDWENAEFHEEYRNAIALLSGSSGGKDG